MTGTASSIRLPIMSYLPNKTRRPSPTVDEKHQWPESTRESMSSDDELPLQQRGESTSWSTRLLHIIPGLTITRSSNPRNNYNYHMASTNDDVDDILETTAVSPWGTRRRMLPMLLRWSKRIILALPILILSLLYDDIPSKVGRHADSL